MLLSESSHSLAINENMLELHKSVDVMNFVELRAQEKTSTKGNFPFSMKVTPSPAFE